MSDSSLDMHYSQQLRNKAEDLLKKGEAGTGRGHALGPDALSVLFDLANSAESAENTLKLLHELQTHQIELDLQIEQSKANERESAEELARYQAIYEFAPVGYFIVSREGIVIQSNRIGATLLGFDPVEVKGQALGNFLTPGSRLTIKRELEKLINGSIRGGYTVLMANSNSGRPLFVKANLEPTGDAVLMVITEQELPASA